MAIATIESPVEAHQIRLIQRILSITDRHLLFQIENFLSNEDIEFEGEAMDERAFEEGEAAFFEERLAAARAHPESLIPVEMAIQNIKVLNLDDVWPNAAFQTVLRKL